MGRLCFPTVAIPDTRFLLFFLDKAFMSLIVLSNIVMETRYGVFMAI